jgi:TPR repeat protein
MSEKTDRLDDGKKRAAEILKSAADGGDDEACIAFACLLNMGIGIERNAELAADYLLAAAENGRAEAQLRLGVMYCLGGGVPQDFDQATNWLWEAEHAGLLEAAVWRNYISVVRRKDTVKRLVELNTAEVIVRNFKRMLEEAVEELPDYSSEPWVEKENIDAVRRHADAAATGSTDSQWKLAFMLATGKGTPQDTSAAREWYLRAAEGGCKTAQLLLGDFYENNAEMMLDHPSNEERAAFWYGEAAKQGHRPAERRLGVLAWRLGLAGETQGKYNDVARWYSISADLGHGLGLWKMGELSTYSEPYIPRERVLSRTIPKRSAGGVKPRSRVIPTRCPVSGFSTSTARAGGASLPSRETLALSGSSEPCTLKATSLHRITPKRSAGTARPVS